MSEPQDHVLLFGSPGFVYTELLLHAFRWLKAWCRRGDTFFYSNKLRHFWSYLCAGYERYRATRTHGVVAELAAFASAYRKKRASRRATKTVSAA